MKTVLFAAAILGSLAFGTVPEHVENKAYAPGKMPALEEPAPSLKFADSEWLDVRPIRAPKCDSGEVWRLFTTHQIAAAAIKEKSIPVKGTFKRVFAYATSGEENFKGSGAVDLSSYDSGLPARDYRVLKHVFAVEKKGKSVLPFTFVLTKKEPQTLKVDFKFEGTPISLEFPVKTKREGGRVTVKTQKAARFTFLTSENMDAFSQLIQKCNHQFLASFADVSLDFVLENVCIK